MVDQHIIVQHFKKNKTEIKILTLNYLELVNYLDKYAETGIEYTKILKQIIEQNKLTDFDDAKILPNSQREKNLI